VGATGVVGRYLLMHLLGRGEWDVLALSRRRPDVAGDYLHLCADLTDAHDCRTSLAGHRDLTHVFYAAYPRPARHRVAGARQHGDAGQRVEAAERAAPGLRHVNLVEGTKWYGSHLGPFKTPAKESDPRHMPPNMYYAQQDALEARQHGKAWSWSAVRPHAVCGFSLAVR